MEFSFVQSEDKWSRLYHSRNLHVGLDTRILADVLVVMAVIIITHIRYSKRLQESKQVQITIQARTQVKLQPVAWK